MDFDFGYELINEIRQEVVQKLSSRNISEEEMDTSCSQLLKM